MDKRSVEEHLYALQVMVAQLGQDVMEMRQHIQGLEKEFHRK